MVIAVAFLSVIAVVFFYFFPAHSASLLKAIREQSITREFSAEFESGLNNSFPQKNSFIDLNGLFHRILMQRLMNGVVLLKNGMESEIMSDRSDEGILACAEAVKGLSDWLEDRDISFLYFQVPMKNDDIDNQLPWGRICPSNRVADVFLQSLKEFGVNYLDLRDQIHQEKIDRYSLYLRTEHHWSPEGGFYAFTKLCEELRNRFGEDIPPYITDLNNYEKEVYPHSSLGYYGQRTGWMFGGFDDFTLIYPGWETKQSSWAPHKELLREGSFYDAIFYTEYLEKPWRDRGLYGTYIGGDWPLVVHHSETAPIDKTIMILIDSYGTMLESFLTTAYKDVVALDLRWVLRTNMDKTTAEFVEEYRPDIVLIAFNPNQIGDPNSEQFQYGIPQDEYIESE